MNVPNRFYFEVLLTLYHLGQHDLNKMRYLVTLERITTFIRQLYVVCAPNSLLMHVRVRRGHQQQQ